MKSLAHVLETVAYAKKSIDDFQAAVALYMRGEPCRLVVEYGFGPAQHIHKAKWLKPIPSDLKHFCFTAVNGLRSALDQSGYAIAKAAGKTGSMAHFPFGESEAVLHNQRVVGDGPSREIPMELFNLMMRFKPYPGGDNALFGMNNLCNVGKHEIIRPMGISIGSMYVDDFSSPGLVYELRIPPSWDSEKNEMVFARTAIDNQVKYNFKLTAFIAINDAAKYVGGQEAVGFLRHLVSKVERIVLALEAEARRVGLFN